MRKICHVNGNDRRIATPKHATDPTKPVRYQPTDLRASTRVATRWSLTIIGDTLPQKANTNPMVITFLYSLTGGILTVLATGRTDEIAWKYLRLIGVITFTLMVGVLTWIMAWGGLALSDVGTLPAWCGVGTTIAAAFVIVLAPVAQRVSTVFRTICALGGLAGLAAAALGTLAWHDFEPAHASATALVVVGQVAGGLLLGSMTAAWILGHAYLTATKMTIAPLRRFCRIMLGCATLRVAFLILSLIVALTVGQSSSPTVMSVLGDSWLILSLRIATGLIGVGAISLMVLGCVRLRSTQSATGLLYFGSILAYIGELASQQIIRECGWPV